MPQKKKDHRYAVVRLMLEKKAIKTFREIFDQIPPTVVADGIKKNHNTFYRLMNNPAEFKLSELYGMAELFGVDPPKFVDWVGKQGR